MADMSLLAEGLEMINQERSVPFRQAFRQHWKALLWSIGLSFALVMDGYDGSYTAMFAHPAFLARFGTKNSKGVLQIPANWQTFFANILLPGNLLALLFVGWAVNRYGHKPVYCLGMVLTFAFVFMFVFAKSLDMMVAGTALMGFAWAIFHTITAAYAVEICPIPLRGIAASFISMAWGLGGFLSAGVARASLNTPGTWGWRMFYAIQWIWPPFLIVIGFLAPESPYWLVRKGKMDEARHSLKRLAGKNFYTERQLDAYLAYIQHTDELEKAESQDASFWEMFKGSNRRRTGAVMCAWFIQQWSGLNMTGYATQMFRNAGMSATGAFNMGLIITSMNIVGCGIEFCIVNRFRRRTLILTGQVILTLCLMIIGVLGCVMGKSVPMLNAVGAFMVLVNLVYHATIGPVTYATAAELPASRLRARTVALGRAFYICNGAVQGQLTPRMFTTPWNWGPRAGFFFMGTNIIALVWAYFGLPETSGFSYAELEILFSNKVPARKFTEANINDEAILVSSKVGDVDGDDEEKGDAAVSLREVKE